MVSSQATRIGAALAMALLALLVGGAPALLAALCSAVLCAVMLPVFRAYAMARPNARSSHRVPVPQGGGLPVVLATLALAAVLALTREPEKALGSAEAMLLLALGCAAVLLAIIGGMDDIRPLPVVPRLAGQALAVGLLLAAAPPTWQILPDLLPLPIERLFLVVAGVWFVNLTNFIDGIDGITLANGIPLAVGAVLLAQVGVASSVGLMVSLGFLGGLAGFTFFNWPPARVFLGDIGSLPIGLFSGYLVFELATHGAIAAAIILPLYPFADATLTLFKRWRRGERLSEAHRQHAYQKAVDAGWSHLRTSALILALNGNLLLLALWSAGKPWQQQTLAVAGAILLTLMTLHWLGRQRKA